MSIMFRFFSSFKKKNTFSSAAYAGRSAPAEEALFGLYLLPLSTNKQQFLGRSDNRLVVISIDLSRLSVE